MTKLKTYSEFLNESHEEVLDTKEKVKAWLDSKKVENYTINDDLTIDVDFDVDLSGSIFYKIPVKFGKVSRSFWCADCDNLTSLKGCPRLVGLNFYCYRCISLTSLEGSPSKTQDFDCDECINLTSLKGAPQKVTGDFFCNGCTGLKTLEGATFGKYFNCTDTIFYIADSLLGSRKLIKIFGGKKPTSKENQELLVKYAIKKELDYSLIEPWLDEKTKEEYKTTLSLSLLGF